MAKSSTHVVSNRDGGWDIKRSGNTQSSAHYDRKQDAIDRARQISRNAGDELVIHNKDGRIASKDSPGRDPHPPKG
jgi:hypothetical protein